MTTGTSTWTAAPSFGGDPLSQRCGTDPATQDRTAAARCQRQTCRLRPGGTARENLEFGAASSPQGISGKARDVTITSNATSAVEAVAIPATCPCSDMLASQFSPLLHLDHPLQPPSHRCQRRGSARSDDSAAPHGGSVSSGGGGQFSRGADTKAERRLRSRISTSERPAGTPPALLTNTSGFASTISLRSAASSVRRHG
jgi:hypothetical protein